VTFMWSVFVLLVLLVAGGFYCIREGWIGYMPPLDELQSPISKYASQIITSDGKVIGTWSRNENRVFVDYDSISPYVFQALVATEDVRFYEHSGIDVRALGRAIVKRGLLRHHEAGGGSTITQQLAKQLYSSTTESTTRRLMQKPIEWVIAVELERHYTKEEILTLYLNYFDFLHNAVGIKTAAQVYFNKQPRDLTITEAATLIGMCKNPSYFNPVREPERCRERRNVVLHQMLKAGYITDAEYAEHCEKPLALNFHRVDHKDGQAAYLREYLRRIMMAKEPNKADYRAWQQQQYYADSLAWAKDPLYGWCNKNFKKDGTPYDIYVDGLKVYTTIDSRMQRYAEEAVRGHVGLYLQKQFEKERASSPNFPYASSLSSADVKRSLQRAMQQTDRYRLMKQAGASDEEIQKAFNTPVQMTIFTYQGEKDVQMTPMDSIRYYKSFLRSGLVSIDPSNGYVKAYVGGLDYTHFQYDMAMVGRRQVGSTMKPFVYTMAMEDGYTPNSTILNVQRTYGGWTPRNSSRSRYGEAVTLKWGLSQSNNWITAELMYQIDPYGTRLVDYLHEFGVANNQIYPSLPLCLGACEITVGEMASAYTAFVNKGIRCAPILVTKIEDDQGNIVAEFTPRMSEVISEETSYKMLDMMQAVIDQGTGRRLRFKYDIKGQIAGKTGTTNENSDGWFMGCVPRLVTACWVGGEERSIHFAVNGAGRFFCPPNLGLLYEEDLSRPFFGI
jgi:penicillin-binding protein 1A